MCSSISNVCIKRLFQFRYFQKNRNFIRKKNRLEFIKIFLFYIKIEIISLVKIKNFGYKTKCQWEIQDNKLISINNDYFKGHDFDLNNCDDVISLFDLINKNNRLVGTEIEYCNIKELNVKIYKYDKAYTDTIWYLYFEKIKCDLEICQDKFIFYPKKENLDTKNITGYYLSEFILSDEYDLQRIISLLNIDLSVFIYIFK